MQVFFERIQKLIYCLSEAACNTTMKLSSKLTTASRIYY